MICGGVILLQLAKAADKISDAAQLSSNLNDVKAVTDVEKGEDDPGADAIRGTLSIRRFSTIRRRSGGSNVDTAGTGSVPLRNWRNRNHASSIIPSDWTLRESTIREVPADEDEQQRKSSVQFDPTAPITHIYPPRQTSTEKFGPEEHIEEIDLSKGSQQQQNQMSPGIKRGLQKQYSFGRGGRENLTEEETMGLVEAGKNEGGMSESDGRDTESQHSQESEVETHYHQASSGRGTREMF